MTHSPHTPIIIFSKSSSSRYILAAGYPFLAFVARKAARVEGAAVFIGTGAGPELVVRTHGLIEPVGDAVNVSPVLQPLLCEPIDFEANALRFADLPREYGRSAGPPQKRNAYRRPATNGVPSFTVGATRS
ncbi:MAG TPA: hypothetical protein VF316_25460 [Polyangiaceae bacterium]